MRTPVNGILNLYHCPRADATTIAEHALAIGRHSRFRTWDVNTVRFPEGLEQLEFSVIVIHYSTIGDGPYGLSDRFRDYIDSCPDSYKILFKQDEYYYCGYTFEFINRHGIDCLYTLLEPKYHDAVYRKYTSVKKLVYTIPGYVSDDLLERAARLTRPEALRTVDVSYRARRLPFNLGREGQEKHQIAEEFARRAAPLGLRLDISAEEGARIYGEAWYEFLANSVAVIGVEAGVTLFDLEDKVLHGYRALMAEKPDITFEEMHERLLKPWDGNIRYRTVSPRHFEAAALRVCQLLFEGHYSGVLAPMRHYIPLKKDWSNFDEAMRLLADADLRRELTDNAYNDLIASGRYSYASYVAEFDAELVAEGLLPGDPGPGAELAHRILEKTA